MTSWTAFRRDIFTQHHWLNQISPEKRILQRRYYFLVKRGIDLLFILLAVPVIIPMMVIIAALIKIEDPKGPIFFVQQRTGKGGKRFSMYKFRTMVYNAEELKAKLAHLNELQWPDFKITHDPRVTRIGRFLRKTSLDELPQLINILKGEMTFVGPRPTSFSPETYTLWQTARLDVVPGITGLWQILGRGTMEFSDRVYLDILYIEHSCLWLDVQIMLRTLIAMIARRGA